MKQPNSKVLAFALILQCRRYAKAPKGKAARRHARQLQTLAKYL